MPTVRLAQTSFALGEFSPLLAARSDIAQYKNGAARLENRRVLAQGGTDTRPGLRYVGPVPEGHGRLLPYVFASDQRYVLRLGAGFVQPYLPDGTPGGTVTGAPWTAAQLPAISHAQSGDTMLLFHPAWAPRRLRRASATTFELDHMPLEYVPYYRFEDPAITLTPSALSGDVMVTASAGAFSAVQKGSSLRYRGQRLLITEVLSETVVNAKWLDDTVGLEDEFAKNPASIEWDEPAWSERRGWPISAAFIDGRLAVGGSALLPNLLWLSRAGALFNWQEGVNDGDAISEVAAGEQSGRIVHLVPTSRLLVMTDGAIWGLVGASTGPITPKNIALRQAAAVGVRQMRPAEVDSATLFLDRTGGTLREIEIDESTNQFTANPVSLLATHLVKQPVSMTVMRGNETRPEVYAVMVNSDGTLATFLSLRTEKIAAFTEWTTDGAFRDACAIGPDLFVLTERAGGLWRLERFDEGAAALDCSKRAVSDTKGRTFGGFGHLAGRTVAVVSRGHDLGDAVVSNAGTITLPERVPDVFEVEVGLRYRQVVRPMPVDFDITTGPTRGLKKRLLRVILQVDRSGQVKIAGRRVLLEFAGDDVDAPPPAWTGLLEARMLGVSKECQFDVEVQGAAKVTLLGLTREVSV